MELMEDLILLGNNDFFQAKDGRWLFLLTSYPHLRNVACGVLGGVASGKAFSLAKAVKDWNAFELERERLREEWVLCCREE